MRGIALACSHTSHIKKHTFGKSQAKNIGVVPCLFLIHSFSRLSITLLLLPSLNALPAHIELFINFSSFMWSLSVFPKTVQHT